MPDESQQNVVIHLSGQDDNLGDSVLRAGLFRALQGRNRAFHVYVRDHRGMDQSSDYMAGLNLGPNALLHETRSSWLAEGSRTRKAVHVFNAGEINPQQRLYPASSRTRELEAVRSQGGAIIVAGVGLKNPDQVSNLRFSPEFQTADIMSWRDYGSRDAAGFGEVNPDWAFLLGAGTDSWNPTGNRPYLTVTLRFDRPYPDRDWLLGVRNIAEQLGASLVTVAQVARDAPRAVRLANDLNAKYLGASSFNHSALQEHIRDVFSQSLAVISDRAHGLIIGATEGAFPIGSGSDPQKIKRLMETVGLGDLVGSYTEINKFGKALPAYLNILAPAVDSARDKLNRLAVRMQALMGSIEPPAHIKH